MLLYIAPTTDYGENPDEIFAGYHTPSTPVAVISVQTTLAPLIRARMLERFRVCKDLRRTVEAFCLLIPARNPCVVVIEAIEAVTPTFGRGPRVMRYEEAHTEKLPNAVRSAL